MVNVEWAKLFEDGRARTPRGPAFDEKDWKLIKEGKATAKELQEKYVEEQTLADAAIIKARQDALKKAEDHKIVEEVVQTGYAQSEPIKVETTPVETTPVETTPVEDGKSHLIDQIKTLSGELGLEEDRKYAESTLNRTGVEKLEAKRAELNDLLIKQQNA